MKNINVIIEKTSTGYSAYADKYPVFTAGGNIGELTRNIVDALNFYFKEANEKTVVTRKNLNLTYSIPSLFELYPINVKHFASRIGMNYTLLAHYVQGRKKPSGKQAGKIVEGLQEIGRELSEVNFI
jgi:hypothetical protein